VTAREEFIRGYGAGDDRPFEQAVTEAAAAARPAAGARARVHAMFALDEQAATELDTRLDALLSEAADAIAADRDTTNPGTGKGAWRRGMTRAEHVVRDLACRMPGGAA
jgi:hypothetical protein